VGLRTGAGLIFGPERGAFGLGWGQGSDCRGMGGGGLCVLTRMAARILSSISFILVSMPSSRTAMRLIRSFTMMGLSRSSWERPEFSGVAPSFSRS